MWMCGVSLIDVSGLELIEELLEQQHKCKGELMVCALQPAVHQMLVRSRLVEEVGKENIFWATDAAILEANRPLGVLQPQFIQLTCGDVQVAKVVGRSIPSPNRGT
jgi:hypothetical protein